MQAYLSNGYLNPLSNFISEKFNKSASLRSWFGQPLDKNSLKSLKKVHVHLSFKWVSKFNIKYQSQERYKSAHF